MCRIIPCSIALRQVILGRPFSYVILYYKISWAKIAELNVINRLIYHLN